MILERGIGDIFCIRMEKRWDKCIMDGEQNLFHKQNAFALFYCHDFFFKASRRAKEKKKGIGSRETGWAITSMAFKRDVRNIFFFFFVFGQNGNWMTSF